jgi:2-C-methyl-D-erythritol 2,4-cyclodiphosphate synthase
VLCHAIADALLGAAGEPDIGHFFPPSDESIRGISSLEILRKIAAILKEKGARINNIDATLVAERPKILPHVPRMKENIAGVLGLEAGQVGIKATTNEGMGFPGRQEGMCAMAVACVEMD